MAEPAQISATRIQDIIDDWIGYIDGNLGDKWIRATPAENVYASGWTQSDNGLSYECSDITKPMLLSFRHESSIEVKGLTALLYVSSTVTGEAPTAQLVEVSSSGVTPLGFALAFPLQIGWQLVTSFLTATVGANSYVAVLVTANHVGDKIGAVFVQGDRL